MNTTTARRVLRDRIRTRRAAAIRTITPTTRRATRPRSLVTHLVRLSGANPLDARLFANSSGRAAIKRLAIKPVVKARTRTTVTGRHVIVAVADKKTGEMVKKNVRRRGRTSRRREGSVNVHRWTLAQAALVIHEMKPRKDEYKEIREMALATLRQPARDALDTYLKDAKNGKEKAKQAVLATITDAYTPKPLRRLPRHRTRSKRR